MENQLTKNPVSYFLHGLRCLPEGFKWLGARPKCLLVACIPVVIFVVLLAVLGVTIFMQLGGIVEWLLGAVTPFLGSWGEWLGGTFLAVILAILSPFITVIVVFASFVVMVVVQGVVSFFFYEYLSRRIEQDLREGEAPDYPSLWEFDSWFGVLVASVQRAVFIFVVSICVSWIPLLNLLTLPVLAFLLSWDYASYVLERRRWRFKDQLGFGLKNMWSSMGLGSVLILPFAQFFLAPFVFVASNIYAVRVLERSQQPAEGSR